MRKGISTTILDTMTFTPLIGPIKLPELFGIDCNIYVKNEGFNLGGCIKIRSALTRIREAERSGELQPGGTILEASSGNQGIVLALIAAAKGYKCIIIMPSNMSKERACIMPLYGARLITSNEDGSEIKTTGEAKKYAEHLAVKNSNYFYMRQFEISPSDDSLSAAHEIVEQMGGIRLDGFVASFGTGYTLTSCARILKKSYPNLRVVAAQPAKSPHIQQGIGVDFTPPILDQNCYEGVITVSDEDAVKTAKNLASKEGILCGITSGTNVWAAMELAKDMPPGSNIVTILPDSGERYLSMLCEEEAK